MILTVDTATRMIEIAGEHASCVIGRNGARAAGAKHEGDGCTPVGRWPLRTVLVRPDRDITPPTKLPWRWLRQTDGWSDDPLDPAYNRAVQHPHGFSAERLWRDDGLYDAIVTLGHNDTAPLAGAGSAIFLHLREGDCTAGCVGIARPLMERLLATLVPGDAIDIV